MFRPLHLMAAGVVPFAAGAVTAGLGWWRVPGLGAVTPWFDTYGLVIAAFMAGTLWGRADPEGARENRPILLLSNAVALALWAGAVMTSGATRDVLLAAEFLALLAIEQILKDALAYPRSYRLMRMAVTTSVVACLLLHAALQSWATA
jgi:hypothetical protein